ncbi:MAG: hypothetical protein KAW45_06450 [Thermoplasmatales archaeon]|nr:hypothetical protein [Thermoplasmatales archaeon]
MTKKSYVFRKGLVIGVIILFVGASIVPSISGNVELKNVLENNIIENVNFFSEPPAEEWNETFGGSSADEGASVQQTTDGGYIIAGTTGSYGTGSVDVWLIKTDSNGNEEWNKTYGDTTYPDCGMSVQQTTDGGYIIVGYRQITTKTNVLIIKTNTTGNLTWERMISGQWNHVGISVDQTNDGGYIIAGFCAITGLNNQVLLIKTNSMGYMEWGKHYGGSSDERGNSVEQTSDGSYIVAGYTRSWGAGKEDVWLIKMDYNGNIIWDRTFGGSENDYAWSVNQTNDDGYIMTGATKSFGTGDNSDVWLIKTDSNGIDDWKKRFGSSNDDIGHSVQQTIDDGYIIAGRTWSYGAGNSDLWLIKTDSNGNMNWNITYGGVEPDIARSVQQTSDYGYITVGNTQSYGAGYTDAWLIKLGPENQPPNTPSDPNPYDGETDVDINADLSWDCSDPDGDPLTYDVYFGINSDPPLVSPGQSETTYDPGTMQYSETYYWKIVAEDEHGATNEGPIWSFTTHINNFPYEPSNPDPYNGEPDVIVNHLLSWSGGDPDGDGVSYDVYFGLSSPPQYEATTDQTYYNPGTMEYSETYYWKIVAEDEHGWITEGDIWSFTTEDPPPNHPPDFSSPVPAEGTTGVPINLEYVSVNINDTEGDAFDWTIEINHNVGSSSGTNEHNGTKTCEITGSLEYSTTYTWHVTAIDPEGSGKTSETTFTFKTEDKPRIPDLECDGSLIWNNVNPGSTLYGSFTVENIGAPNSELDWEIESYPDWGKQWIFEPDSGEDLTPEDGAITVNVSVIAPKVIDIFNNVYTGEVKVVNTEDDSDYEIIDVSLTTPRIRVIHTLFLKLLESHPILYQLLLRFLRL